MANKRKAFIILAGLLLVVLLAGLSLSSGNQNGVDVRTELVSRRDLVSVVEASGKIEPKRKIDISADISGRVVQVAVEEGQWVDQGDLLLRIDPTNYAAQVRSAEAAVSQAQARGAQARANLLEAESAQKRAEFLAGGNELISAQALEEARTRAQVARAEAEATRFAVQQAQATLSSARDALSKTTIAAPMSGTITRLNIEEGETAIIGTMNNPGSLLLTIADLSAMEAKVKVDETDVPSITIGDSAAVKIDAFPDRTFTGRVTRIANSALQGAGATGQQQGGEQSVDFEVVITLDNPPESLRPDLSATAEIVTETRPDALSVPILALTVRDSAGRKFRASDDEDSEGSAAAASSRAGEEEVEGVFVVRDGKAQWVPVEVGITGDQYFEVRNGLTGGEAVVSGTYQAIRDLQAGAVVKVKPGAGPAGAPKGPPAAEKKG